MFPSHTGRLRIAVVYNNCDSGTRDAPGDRAGMADLRKMIRHTVRVLRELGHAATVLPLQRSLLSFQRRLLRLRPDVVFNQYDDVVPGAVHEMDVAALIRLLGFPMTGCPPLALGLCRDKYATAQLLRGAGVRIPADTCLLARASDAGQHAWQFPLIVQPNQEHGGAGLDRASIVTSVRALQARTARIVRMYRQPALVRRYLPGREFSVGILGGQRLHVLPLAEVDYAALPRGIPPIMSYAAKWLENSADYRKTSDVCPAQVAPSLADEIRDAALRAFRALGGWGYGRVDIRLEESGRPAVLDVNCNPCLEEGVGLARNAQRAGIAFPRLLQIILAVALEEPPSDPS